MSTFLTYVIWTWLRFPIAIFMEFLLQWICIIVEIQPKRISIMQRVLDHYGVLQKHLYLSMPERRSSLLTKPTSSRFSKLLTPMNYRRNMEVILIIWNSFGPPNAQINSLIHFRNRRRADKSRHNLSFIQFVMMLSSLKKDKQAKDYVVVVLVETVTYFENKTIQYTNMLIY